MKTFRYNGTWYSEKPLTREQNLFNRNPENKNKIQRERESPSEAELAILNGVWDEQKPTEENYRLVDCSVTIEGNGTYRGIINYQVAGNHLQKRF